jgi:hypothetical protein
MEQRIRWDSEKRRKLSCRGSSPTAQSWPDQGTKLRAVSHEFWRSISSGSLSQRIMHGPLKRKKPTSRSTVGLDWDWSCYLGPDIIRRSNAFFPASRLIQTFPARWKSVDVVFQIHYVKALLFCKRILHPGHPSGYGSDRSP